MKIVFLDQSTVGNASIECLHQFGELTTYDNSSKEQVQERVRNQHVIITNKVVIDKSVMDAAPNLKLICVAATGVNNVDLDYAMSKGIPVKNVAGYSTESVAQATFSSLLYMINQINYFDNYVKSGEYAKSEIFTHHGRSFWQLADKNFGIIGLGAIGKRVASIASAFGCKVSFFSASGKNQDSTYFRHLTLDSLLSSSDIVSIHAPLNEFTAGLIKYDQLIKMKKTAILINMGRGGIVNESDLARALNEDRIGGAALDVLEQEPISQQNPLLKINNPNKLLITPHIAWASLEARNLLIEKICSNIKDYIKTRENL